MALLWTGAGHVTPEKTDLRRDYDLIAAAGAAARSAALPGPADAAADAGDGGGAGGDGGGGDKVAAMARAVALSYEAQLGEGMAPLPEAAGALARKYCGGGCADWPLLLLLLPACAACPFLGSVHTEGAGAGAVRG